MIRFETKNYWYGLTFDKTLSPWAWGKLYGHGQRRAMYFFLFMTLEVIDRREYDDEWKMVTHNIFKNHKRITIDEDTITK